MDKPYTDLSDFDADGYVVRVGYRINKKPRLSQVSLTFNAGCVQTVVELDVEEALQLSEAIAAALDILAV